MHLRQRARDRHLFDEELLTRLAERQSTLNERHDTQREALALCLKRLPAHHRELVLSAYHPDTQIQTLAESRGETAMSLYKRLHRIRIALLACVRKALAQEELA
jgi:RNA polymerase sigma-70 factor (ECF subfamily)